MCQAFFLGAREVTESIVPSSMDFPVQRMIQRSEHTVIISVLSAVLEETLSATGLRGESQAQTQENREASPRKRFKAERYQEMKGMEGSCGVCKRNLHVS